MFAKLQAETKGRAESSIYRVLNEYPEAIDRLFFAHIVVLIPGTNDGENKKDN